LVGFKSIMNLTPALMCSNGGGLGIRNGWLGWTRFKM